MQRQTTQRRAILKVLESSHGPMTPQEILAEAQKEKAGLGIATVYRNLNLLEETGDVLTVHLPNEAARYEHGSRSHHHHHFHCRNCGQVFDIHAECPIAMLKNAVLSSGFKVMDHELTFYGLCPTCSEKAEVQAVKNGASRKSGGAVVTKNPGAQSTGAGSGNKERKALDAQRKKK